MSEKYRITDVGPEGQSRYTSYEARGSEVSPPTIDEVAPPGVEGELTKEKPTVRKDEEERALREKANKNAEKAYGTGDDDLPYWAK